jgi:pimeloyl-ACP methyl ester carboxylesterase
VNVIDRGSGTPLILLHGFGVDHRILLPLEPVFQAAGSWRRIYLDLPGTAGTAIGVIASSDDVVAAVKEEIIRRIGDEPFAILGNSFGGMIARKVAHDLRPRVLGLATLAAVFVAAHEQRTLPTRTVLSSDPEAVVVAGPAAKDYAEMAVVQSADNARSFLEHVLPGSVGVDQAGLDRIAARYALEREPEEAHPEPFTQPSLFVTARQDHVVGYQDAWSRFEHYPRATFIVLDAAGHNVHLDQPSLTAPLLTDWLTRIRAAGG